MTRQDPFIARMFAATRMSARRFRKMINAIRLYDKEYADIKRFSKKDDVAYDEHFKVNTPISVKQQKKQFQFSETVGDVFNFF